eukprot:CCRYP_007406-RA/>CCRYP_007406-RA protein AED:0.42 eAED:0.42 QI:0/0/0/1/1/1/2/0/192
MQPNGHVGGRASKIVDGVLHINPAFLDQIREEFKCRCAEKLQECEKDETLQECDSSKNNKGLMEDHLVIHVLGVILATQDNIQTGIKLFGEQGRKSVKSELQQLHGMITYVPVHTRTLKGGSCIPDVHDGEKVWSCEEQGMCKRKQAEKVDPQGRGSVTQPDERQCNDNISDRGARGKKSDNTGHSRSILEC